MKYIAIILGVFLISSCATQISKTKVFDVSSKDGLVVLGVTSKSGPYALSFVKINPITCKALNWGGFGDKKFDNTLKSNTNEQHYIIDTFEPGTWVVGAVEFPRGFQTSIGVFSQGTIAFTVKPGEFIHVGDIAISNVLAAINESNSERLNLFLEQFSNIQMKPTEIKPWSTHYYTYSSKLENTLCRPKGEV